MNSGFEDLAANLVRVRERIDLAAERASRRADEITLIAVSKTHSAKRIRELYQTGIRHFGENRVQEWESKQKDLADLGATWHMIGHVQKNKAARAACLFDSVDSVDSLALTERLDRARAEFSAEQENTESAEKPEKIETKGLNRIRKSPSLRVLIEVKLDPEPAKSGAAFEDIPRLVEAVMRLPHLELSGLMGVPPFFDDPEQVRPYFRRLRKLRDTTRKQFDLETFSALSMGMSHDFEIAIQEGATEIRVGTALFGERKSL